MSLVAYDSSDEGSENEESEETTIANNNNDVIEAVTAPTNLKLSLPAPKVVSESINNEEEKEENVENFETLFNMLPKPKIQNTTGNIEENDDILLKKETRNHDVKLAKKQTVKITVPSLSEFKDLEEESEQKPEMIIQPSKSACGLFSILVPPTEKIANKSKMLIPQAVKNTVTRTSTHQTKILKESGKSRITANKSLDEVDSDEDEEDGADFFGLTSSKNVSNNSATELLDTELHSSDLTNKLIDGNTRLTKHTEDGTTHDSSLTGSVISANNQSSNSNKTLTSNIMNLSKEEIIMKNKAEVGPKLPVPEQEYNVDTEGNIAFDEKAIEYLCGKRGVKRKDREIDGANIIEISGEDIKPDEREWLVKALTEEPVQRPISMQSCGINSQSKKKHQITYLAHQAKAMELELKNQWSQNRMARKQAKSKYGF